VLFFDNQYSMRIQTELQHLTDPKPNLIVSGEWEGKKVYVYKDHIKYFREYDKQTDKTVSKQR